MARVLFDHIAIGLPRIADAAPFLSGVLGGVPDAGRPSPVFRWGTWRFAGGGSIEALEPLGDDGFLHRFLAQRGPGVHHVTFKVPSTRAACDRAVAAGLKPVGFDDSDPRWIEAFLHPKEALGIVVQFAEAHGDDDDPGEPPPGVPAGAAAGHRARAAAARPHARAGRPPVGRHPPGCRRGVGPRSGDVSLAGLTHAPGRGAKPARGGGTARHRDRERALGGPARWPAPATGCDLHSRRDLSPRRSRA